MGAHRDVWIIDRAARVIGMLRNVEGFVLSREISATCCCNFNYRYTSCDTERSFNGALHAIYMVNAIFFRIKYGFNKRRAYFYAIKIDAELISSIMDVGKNDESSARFLSPTFSFRTHAR